MSKRETDLTSRLCAVLREELTNSVVLKHTDMLTADVPDISVTWAGFTTWLEGKILQEDGTVKGKDSQFQQMRRMSLMGSARYVVYKHTLPSETYVVLPADFDSTRRIVRSEVKVPHVDHHAVAAFVRKLHFSLSRGRR